MDTESRIWDSMALTKPKVRLGGVLQMYADAYCVGESGPFLRPISP